MNVEKQQWSVKEKNRPLAPCVTHSSEEKNDPLRFSSIKGLIISINGANLWEEKYIVLFNFTHVHRWHGLKDCLTAAHTHTASLSHELLIKYCHS